MSNQQVSPEEIPALLESFQQRRSSLQTFLKAKGINKTCCPCCGYPTLSERNSFEICIICNWEDDGQDDIDADKVLGGPNGSSSLTGDRLVFEKNFVKYEQLSGNKRIGDPEKILRNIQQEIDRLETLVSRSDFEEIFATNTVENSDGDLSPTYAILTVAPT